MTDLFNRLTKHVCSKLRILGFSSPSISVMHALLETSFLASIKTEESRFVRGSLTFSDPNAPELDPPPCRRADYPSFTAFGKRTPLNAGSLVKLSRAIDSWSASIAVYGTKKTDIYIWGVADQLVGHNIRLNREAEKGFSIPGIITVNIDGVGDISIYHSDLFLGRLRQSQIILQESEALRSSMVTNCVAPALTPSAIGIAAALDEKDEAGHFLGLLSNAWANTVARICIGLRRLGTGGSLLITPNPITSKLEIGHRFPYRRLSDSTILNVLDTQYQWKMEEQDCNSQQSSIEVGFAQADAEDRADELTGAVKVVTSLAAVDGLVLMSPSLAIVGFGVKIGAGKHVNTVYEGPHFAQKGTQARKINISHFGTRHASMLRYCQADRSAIGIVMSQDGHTRLIGSVGRSLVLWDNVKLLGHNSDVRAYARERQRWRQGSSQITDRTLGFTDMPKTISALLACGV